MEIRYTCSTCGAAYVTGKIIYRCLECERAPADSGFQRGNLLTVLAAPPHAQPGKPVDPLAFLPIRIRQPAVFPAGGTPLVEPERLREEAGFPLLFLKDDTRNPSGSLKDRASLLVAEQARSHGEKTVTLASTGNAGAAMAAAGAACGLEVVLFVPSAAPRAKLLQSLLYGARVVPVKGTYDDAYALSIRYTKRFGGVNRNTGYNPFTVEGKKTVSLEIYNQLGCRVPDVLYVPAGDGVILSGAAKGFADLVEVGLAPSLPRLVAVQPEGSNAIARSWREGREVVLEKTSTIADSLAVASPSNGAMALDFLRRSSGRAVEVSDAEISSAQLALARGCGIFVEPSSAAAWAGFLKDRENTDPSATVVVLLTGTGFKDTRAAEGLVSLPEPCDPSLDAAVELLEKLRKEEGNSGRLRPSPQI
jgi:threonine synthase